MELSNPKKNKTKSEPKKLFDFEVTIKDHGVSSQNAEEKTYVGKFHEKKEGLATKSKDKKPKKKKESKKKKEEKEVEQITEELENAAKKCHKSDKTKTSKLCSGSAAGNSSGPHKKKSKLDLS